MMEAHGHLLPVLLQSRVGSDPVLDCLIHGLREVGNSGHHGLFLLCCVRNEDVGTASGEAELCADCLEPCGELDQSLLMPDRPREPVSGYRARNIHHMQATRLRKLQRGAIGRCMCIVEGRLL